MFNHNGYDFYDDESEVAICNYTGMWKKILYTLQFYLHLLLVHTYKMDTNTSAYRL